MRGYTAPESDSRLCNRPAQQYIFGIKTKAKTACVYRVSIMPGRSRPRAA